MVYGLKGSELDDPEAVAAYVKLRSCTGKQQFETKVDAKKFVNKKRSNSRVRVDQRQNEAYHCPHCNKFHVGGNQELKLRKARNWGKTRRIL